jgi:hypothetical protein
MLGFGLTASDDCVDLASKVIRTVDTPDEAGGESDGVVRLWSSVVFPFLSFLFLPSILSFRRLRRARASPPAPH